MNILKTLIAAVSIAALAITPALPASAASSGGSGGARTDRTFQNYTGSKYTSRYHIYAAGLDWTRPVGMLIYADGSGEYGLKNPNSTYLLAGTNGLINVAKRNNMVLLTPFAPNTACADGDGSCWYQGDPVGYAKWAEELVTHVQGQYPIERDRVAFGGYSSGAQLATEWWVPSGAAQRTMTDGVVVAISYGGSPKMTESAYAAAFKSNVHLNWNTGDRDSAYTTNGSYGVKAGYNHYTNRGFNTSLDVISGLGHSRNDFGRVMEAQIQRHVPAGSTTPTPPTDPPVTPPTDPPTPPTPPTNPGTQAFATTVTAASTSARFTVNVPDGTSPATYVYIYWGSGNYRYQYSYRDGSAVPFSFSSLRSGTSYTYKVYSAGVQKAEGSFRTR